MLVRPHNNPLCPGGYSKEGVGGWRAGPPARGDAILDAGKVLEQAPKPGCSPPCSPLQYCGRWGACHGREEGGNEGLSHPHQLCLPQVEANEILPPRVHGCDGCGGNNSPDPRVGDARGGAKEPEVCTCDSHPGWEYLVDFPNDRPCHGAVVEVVEAPGKGCLIGGKDGCCNGAGITTRAGM